MTRLEELSINYEKLLNEAQAKNSKRALESDWRVWSAWCRLESCAEMPATDDQVCAFLLNFETKKNSTLARYLWAVESLHASNGFGVHWPKAHKVISALKRKKKEQKKKARPLTINQLEAILTKTGLNLLEVRNSAILALGWCAALRSAEICALNWEDVSRTLDGIVIDVRSSKTDQEAQGYKISIPFAPVGLVCPARVVEKYMTLFQQSSDLPFFFGMNRRALRNEFLIMGSFKKIKRLNPRTIGFIVRRCLRLSGFSSAGYSSHSLRAGFATSCAAAGVPEWAIRRVTRHKCIKSLDEYIRIGELFSASHPLATLQATRSGLRRLGS